MDRIPLSNMSAAPSATLATLPPQPDHTVDAVAWAQQSIESLMVYTTPTTPGQSSETYLVAAWPGYQSSFTRDTVITLGLAGDAQKLQRQIAFIAKRQGQKADPMTWEEPGKIHHELPARMLNGKLSAYNACDTTAEFLRGIVILMEHGDRELLGRYAPNIAMAVGYIKRHVNELGLFVEDPLFAGIEGPERHGALKVTYWKDSELNRIESTTPHYPIVYSLAHFQNAEALVRLGRIVGDEDLEALGALMMGSGIKYLWRGDHFVTALDSDGIIDAPSSDSLHCLLYIPPEFLPAGCSEKIESYSTQLETPAGYRAGIPVAPTIDPYHTMTVWTHEQALLHVAAKKYGLVHAQAVAERIVPYIHPERGVYPEYVHAVTLQPGGNPCQAWAMGAYIYFQRPTHALL